MRETCAGNFKRSLKRNTSAFTIDRKGQAEAEGLLLSVQTTYQVPFHSQLANVNLALQGCEHLQQPLLSMSVVTEVPTTCQNGSGNSTSEITDQLGGGRHIGNGLKLRNNIVFLFFFFSGSP